MHSFTGFPNNDPGFFRDAAGNVDVDQTLERTNLLYAREGRGSTVSVIGNEGFRSMLINGRAVATDALDDMQHEYLLGHLPVLLHPDPKSAIVIGLGAGLTLGGVTAHESIERVVVVEIEPAVRDAAQLFADLHDDAPADPRVEFVWQDGRNYLRTTNEHFDVITTDPIHPWAQGGAYLYTTEYYRILVDHLNPGGIVCQWLPLYELSESDVDSAIASFLEQFEYATLWQASTDALLIGSNAPIGVDLDALAARVAEPRVSRQLARIGLDEPLSFLAEFTMDRSAMERISKGATVNTDDNLHLEFSSPYAIGSGQIVARNVVRIDGYRTDATAVVRDAGSRFGSARELESRLAALRSAKSRVMHAVQLWEERIGWPTQEGMQELAAAYREALELAPGYRQAQLRLAVSYAALGELRLESGDSEAALALFRQALDADPGNTRANLHVGVEWADQGQLDRALAHFDTASRRSPRSVDAHAAAAQALIKLGRFEDALGRLRTAAQLRPDLAELRRLRCVCLRELGELEAAVDACRAAHAMAPRASEIALELADTLALAGNHREAVALLRDVLASDRSELEVRLRLAWLLSTSPDPGARDGLEAVGLVAAAAERTRSPRILGVLAAALAESGRFESAAETASRGAELADEAGQSEMAAKLRARGAAYRSGRSLRERG
jgi:spermidine synthase/Flp pilus assembly protein TadD